MKDNVYELIQLLVSFQSVERGVVVPGSTRKENDTEHSYNLAMAAWLIIEKDKLVLNLDKVLRYALVHDLVEVYAGDSFALDPAQVATKAEKEIAAMKRLESNELTSGLSKYIEEYESLANEEAKFVYALDKLMPAFGILYGNDSIWKEHGMSQTDWETKFKAKIEVSEYTKPYLAFVLNEQKAHPKLFI